MVEYENECVGCPREIGCLGNACQYVNVKHLYCDKCKTDVDELYDLYGEQLCTECLFKSIDKITLND